MQRRKYAPITCLCELKCFNLSKKFAWRCVAKANQHWDSPDVTETQKWSMLFQWLGVNDDCSTSRLFRWTLESTRRTCWDDDNNNVYIEITFYKSPETHAGYGNALCSKQYSCLLRSGCICESNARQKFASRFVWTHSWESFFCIAYSYFWYTAHFANNISVLLFK